MPVLNHKCWLGKPGSFQEEINQLLALLAEIVEGKDNLIVFSEPTDDFSGTFPTTGGHVALQTSGTTGIPKVVWKDYNQVLKDKKGHGSCDDKWLLTYNPGRWAGLSVIIHTIKTQAQLIVPKDLSLPSLLAAIPQATHVSLTPSLFRKMMISGYSQLEKAQFRQVTFGGEYAIQKVLDDAKILWPEAKITHIYATTELGDICACSDSLEGFPINKLKVPFVIGENQELILSGIPTGDTWKLLNDRLYFIGRMTEVINVGGAKVTQSVIEIAANSIPEIKECKAYAIPNQLLGQVVGLDYVGDIDSLSIRKVLTKILPKYAVPVICNKVETIQLSSAGKLIRK